MKPIIEIKNVKYQYPGADKPVLNHVSLSVDKGDFVAILGGNGSGKSTLCKLINGLIPHYYVGDYSGEVLVKGMAAEKHKVAELSRHVGYVYQDFENQIVSPKVIEDAEFAPLHYGLADYHERAVHALDVVGLIDQQHKFIWQLSGGQKHLLALASILSLNPDIIIMDEPVAQLDPQHAREIYDILKKLNDEGKTIIVIEHHTEFVAAYARNVILMDQGDVLFKKPVKEALNEVDVLLEHQIYPPQVTQAAAKIGTSGILPITIGEAIPLMASIVECEQNTVHKLRTEDKPLVTFEDVTFSYKTITRERDQVLHDVNLTIHQGDYIALVGNNGAGKSSLMRLITGLVKQEKGQIALDGKDVRKTPPEHLAEIVTYIHQNPEHMFIDDCVKKDIGFYMKARKDPRTEEKVANLLKQFELTDLAERDSRLLSGGQQRRASLAVGVGMQPKLMLLDEPTANLDIATRKHITRILEELKTQLQAVVIATHDMQLACEFANRIIVMHEGRIIHDGTKASVFTNHNLLKKAGLNPPQIFTLAKKLGWERPVYTVDDFIELYQSKEAWDGVHA
ncbi:energy-coupling factor transport system ATP-binding protein [Gracilibacillus ureilyticus]|uniref:Energy-coupling factor transport system ATP-binding protein n=1 Tax=Gracilibacillus ureilyticus TaxID=531814 RepID=A0A1H9VKQ4_9BACI|nr:energy-coupling factor transporter ATPase [Gracilibacillus ureilyticus]SES21927.1 energy-coupling factor transport system ATP-binding protein [Gracilibacillus ureilyticus]